MKSLVRRSVVALMALVTFPLVAAAQDPSIQAQTPAVQAEPKTSYWTIGLGPFNPQRLGSDATMYGVSGGYMWDFTSRFSLKVIGEGAFSSGKGGANFLNAALGGNFFLAQANNETAPYVTADLGYGFAEDVNDRKADGMSAGAGFGVQFWRTSETTLDVLLRYAVLLDDIEGTTDNPSILGARLAVNF